MSVVVIGQHRRRLGCRRLDGILAAKVLKLAVAMGVMRGYIGGKFGHESPILSVVDARRVRSNASGDR